MYDILYDDFTSLSLHTKILLFTSKRTAEANLLRSLSMAPFLTLTISTYFNPFFFQRSAARTATPPEGSVRCPVTAAAAWAGRGRPAAPASHCPAASTATVTSHWSASVCLATLDCCVRLVSKTVKAEDFTTFPIIAAVGLPGQPLRQLCRVQVSAWLHCTVVSHA